VDGLLLPVDDRLVYWLLPGFCHSFFWDSVVLGPHLINFPFSPSRRSLGSYWLYVQ
jgi:hypothetical protein